MHWRKNGRNTMLDSMWRKCSDILRNVKIRSSIPPEVFSRACTLKLALVQKNGRLTPLVLRRSKQFNQLVYRFKGVLTDGQ